jgi:hypothetical protein
MEIVEYYSHLNGQEHILVHKPGMWDELQLVIASINADKYKIKESKEKTRTGRYLYSPIELNKAFKSLLSARGWHESRTSYWVTKDQQLIRKTMNLPAAQQRAVIQAAGHEPISSYNQTDYLKDRIAIEVQFGKYSFVAFDLFVKHMAFFVGDVIDVGVEIMPMKVLAEEMSSGVAYYERELYNVIRQGRGVPAVPLVLIGVCP